MKYFKYTLNTVVVGLIFYFILKNLQSNWSNSSLTELHFNYLQLFLSLLTALLALWLSAWGWGRTLVALGHKADHSTVYVIYARSMLGRYLPGKIWQITASTYLGTKRGIPEGATVASVVVGQGYSVLSGMALLAVCLVLGVLEESTRILESFKWSALPAIIAIIVVTLRPNLMESAMNWALRLFKRPPVSIKISNLSAVELFIDFLLPWFLFGLSFWFFAKTVTSVGLADYVQFTSILTAAVIVGFLAFMTPGGLGVREGVIVLFLSQLPAFPAPLPSAIALGYRIVLTLAEVIAFALTWVVEWNSTRKKNVAENIREADV